MHDGPIRMSRLRFLRIARPRVNVHIALETVHLYRAIAVGHSVVRPGNIDRSYSHTSHTCSESPGSVHRDTAVIKSEFVAIKLNHGLGTDIGERSYGFDSRTDFLWSAD